jgi:hypothetical protein
LLAAFFCLLAASGGAARRRNESTGVKEARRSRRKTRTITEQMPAEHHGLWWRRMRFAGLDANRSAAGRSRSASKIAAATSGDLPQPRLSAVICG